MKNFKKLFTLSAILMALCIMPATITRASDGVVDTNASEIDTSQDNLADVTNETVSSVKLESNASTWSDVIEFVSQQPYRVLHLKNSRMQTYNANSNSTDVTMYQDWRFTWRSAPERIVLQADCDTISLHATCTGDIIDTSVVCNIADITHDGLYSTCLTFEADGAVHTTLWAFPEGVYKIYFTGDSDIEKSYALAVFSMLN